MGRPSAAVKQLSTTSQSGPQCPQHALLLLVLPPRLEVVRVPIPASSSTADFKHPGTPLQNHCAPPLGLCLRPSHPAEAGACVNV